MNEKYNSQELVEKIKFRWTKGKEIISNNTTKNSKKLRKTRKPSATSKNKKLGRSTTSNSKAMAWIIDSKILGEKFALVRHTAVKLPYRYRNLPRYTFEEAKQLIKASSPPEMLKEIHMVKTVFNGQILPE